MTTSYGTAMDGEAFPGSSTSTAIPIGHPVFTRDGEELGKVKECRADSFKVDAALQTDYWLSMADVGAVTGDGVLMKIDKDHLGECKVDNPDKPHERTLPIL